jgi:hypothetical protein
MLQDSPGDKPIEVACASGCQFPSDDLAAFEMKHRKLYSGTLALGFLGLIISGVANHRSWPYWAAGIGGSVLLAWLPHGATRWDPLKVRINPKLALLIISVLLSILLAEAILQIGFVREFPPPTQGYKNAFDPRAGLVACSQLSGAGQRTCPGQQQHGVSRG